MKSCALHSPWDYIPGFPHLCVNSAMWNHLLPARWVSFSISCCVCLLVINSFNVCISEKVTYFPPLWLKMFSLSLALTKFDKMYLSVIFFVFLVHEVC